MSDNRRQAYRYAVAQPDARALLRISEGEVNVRLVDESANGFGVESDRELFVREGELAGLTTQAGQSICRVTRVEYDDAGSTSIGLQRISEIAEEPKTGGNAGLLARWFGRSLSSVAMLLAFGVGLGAVMGFAKFSAMPFGGAQQASVLRPDIPRDPSQRTAALTQSFNNLDELKSRQFVKTLNITDTQQRKIDTIVDKLVVQLANVHIDRGDHSPETSSHMGLLMIRRAWTQVEEILTPDQMTKWDAILDGKLEPSVSDQART